MKGPNSNIARAVTKHDFAIRCARKRGGKITRSGVKSRGCRKTAANKTRTPGWLKQPRSYLQVMHFCLVVPTPVRKVHEYDQRVYKYDEMSYETTSGHSWVSFHINIRSLLRYPSITFARH